MNKSVFTAALIYQPTKPWCSEIKKTDLSQSCGIIRSRKTIMDFIESSVEACAVTTIIKRTVLNNSTMASSKVVHVKGQISFLTADVGSLPDKLHIR